VARKFTEKNDNGTDSVPVRVKPELSNCSSPLKVSPVNEPESTIPLKVYLTVAASVVGAASNKIPHKVADEMILSNLNTCLS
jgi:hypothetical protein